MPSLWLMQQSLEGLGAYMRSADRSPSGSLVANLTDVLGSAAGPGEERVTPILMIDDGFALDLFDEGVTFASSSLIETMALPAGAARIGDVDDRRCGAAVRRMGYRTLELLLRADALDPAESEGEVVAWVDGNGVVRNEWLLAAPEPNRPPPRACWRIGFEPPGELFLVGGTPWRAAADPLAARILTSGAVGLDFVDPVASAATGDLVVRLP